MINIESIYRLLIQIQHGLFGYAPPNLRAVTAEEFGDENIRVNFYYHEVITDDDYEDSEIVLTEIDDDDIKMNGYIMRSCIRLDKNTSIPKIGYLIYKMHEEPYFSFEPDGRKPRDLHYDYLYPENFRKDLRKMFGDNIHPLAMLSGQKAMLNRVDENLVTAILKHDNKNIWLNFYYKGEITEINRKSAKEAADDLIISFPKHKLHLKVLSEKEFINCKDEPYVWTAIFSAGCADTN